MRAVVWFWGDAARSSQGPPILRGALGNRWACHLSLEPAADLIPRAAGNISTVFLIAVETAPSSLGVTFLWRRRGFVFIFAELQNSFLTRYI